MAEYKVPRPVTEIQAEYSSQCTRAGHLQYQIDALTRDLKILNDLLRDLNFEGAAAAKAEQEAAAKAKAEQDPNTPPTGSILSEVK